MEFEQQDETAPHQARRALLPLFPDDGPVADNVTLVASELVSNVVLHTEDGGSISAWNADPFRLEVSDRSPIEPERNDHPDEHGGSGLNIVEGVADRWGTTPNDTGKTVWAEFER